MIKLLGASLILASCSFFGFSLVSRLTSRVTLLTELLSILRVLRVEIGASLAPLPELIVRLSKTHPLPAALWKNCIERWKPWQGVSFASCWERGLSELDLRPRERHILNEAGSLLGRYDAQRQSEGLASAERELEACLTAAREERTRLGRVLGALGVVSGLVTVILLL